MARPHKYTEEFRRDAVALVREQGMPVRRAAADLGIHSTVLDGWLKADREAEETGCDDCRLLLVSSTGERFRLRQGVAVRHDDVNSEDVVRAVTDAEAPEFPGDFICVSGKDLDLTADTTDGTAQIQVAGHWHLIRSSSPRLAGMRLAATRSTQISDLRESRVTPRAHHGVGEGP